MDEELKISSDLTQFYRYSFYPMVTLGFVCFAILSFSNGQLLIALVLIPFVLFSTVLSFVNPYRKLTKVVVNLETKTFVVDEKNNNRIEIGIDELEKYSISRGICKLYFRNRNVVSFLLPLSFENPPKHSVINLLNEAIVK